MRKKAHELSGTPTYTSWASMIGRCSRPTDSYYADYGGRGIDVCEKWLSFAGFVEDMGERPEGRTLDRIDGNKGYCKENCRWATSTEQARNKRNNVRYLYHGQHLMVPEIYELLSREGIVPKVSQNAAANRLRKGWDVADALFTELGSYRPNHENGSFVYYCFFGERLSIREAIEKYGWHLDECPSENCIYRRIKRGWNPSEALVSKPHKGVKDEVRRN